MRQAPDDDAFDECGVRILEALTRQQRISTLVHIPGFDGPVRARRERQKALLDLVNGVGDRHLGTAIVIGVPGMKGLMLRFTANAMMMVTRVGKPVRLHASLEDAVRWLAKLPAQSLALQDNAALVQELSALS
ncbi:MAG: hypothetical protein Q8L48_27730 [Archangium sp.]|nr:hypothetical protein [Archangium sp.]